MRQCRDVVVVGASAGGVESLRELVSALPADPQAVMLMVLPMRASSTSALPAIPRRAGKLPVHSAPHGQPLRHGHTHTAVPDHHLVVVGDAMALSKGPTENGHRPSADAGLVAIGLRQDLPELDTLGQPSGSPTPTVAGA